ncbi:MAG: hypothetical protein H0U27_04620 [Nitrosopumilus sp.]|nr:hypothetical protein [Nitrosopumilus sp.]
MDTLNKENVPHVALMGDSMSYEADSPNGFNEGVLRPLFMEMTKQHPQALFFIGNFVTGLKKNEIFKNPKQNASSTEINSDKPVRELIRKGFYYDSNSYTSQIEQFSKLEKIILGPQTAFYPVIGLQDAVGSDSKEILLKQFPVTNKVDFGKNQLVYTVALEDSYFIVITTDFFDEFLNLPVENQIPRNVLDWLDRDLKDKSPYYRYLFVVGHKPAFSTTASSGVYAGLDKNPLIRDAFWKILKDNNVLAYFCASENLYDRSFRDGVWQIITGGAGSPLNKKNIFKAFYHYVLLSLPTAIDKAPRAWVIDVNGKLRDTFEFANSQNPIFQLRISQSDKGKK